MATPLRPVGLDPDRRRLPLDRRRWRRVGSTVAVAGLLVAAVACSSDDSDEPSDPTLAPEPAGGEAPVEDPVTDEGGVDE